MRDGDFDQAEAYLAKLLETMHQTSPGSNPEYSFVSCLIPMLCFNTGKSERFDVAAEAAQAVLSSSDDDGLGEFGLVARSGLGLMAVLEGGAAAAREQCAALESLPGLMLVLGGQCVANSVAAQPPSAHVTDGGMGTFGVDLGNDGLVDGSHFGIGAVI